MRRGLSRRKVFDQVFVLVGLIVMLACLAILAVLFIDLVLDGARALRLGLLHELRLAPRRARRHSRARGSARR